MLHHQIHVRLCLEALPQQNDVLVSESGQDSDFFDHLSLALGIAKF